MLPEGRSAATQVRTSFTAVGSGRVLRNCAVGRLDRAHRRLGLPPGVQHHLDHPSWSHHSLAGERRARKRPRRVTHTPGTAPILDSGRRQNPDRAIGA